MADPPSEKLSEPSNSISETQHQTVSPELQAAEKASSKMRSKIRQSQTGTGTIAEALGRRNFLWAIFWIIFLALGALGEQIKTRWEYAQGEGKNRKIGDIPDSDRQEIVTASGLHYIDIKQGAGEAPHPGDLCLVNYRLELADGTPIISSRDPGQKALAFILGAKGQRNAMIPPGLEEGVSTMGQGGKRKLIIPPNLGFGGEPRFFPNVTVEPGSTVVYEVELAKVSIAPS